MTYIVIVILKNLIKMIIWKYIKYGANINNCINN